MCGRSQYTQVYNVPRDHQLHHPPLLQSSQLIYLDGTDHRWQRDSTRLCITTTGRRCMVLSAPSPEPSTMRIAPNHHTVATTMNHYCTRKRDGHGCPPRKHKRNKTSRFPHRVRAAAKCRRSSIRHTKRMASRWRPVHRYHPDPVHDPEPMTHAIQTQPTSHPPTTATHVRTTHMLCDVARRARVHARPASHHLRPYHEHSPRSGDLRTA